MPFAGLGLHFLIALYFAVHAMRNRQQMYWLFVLFSFPLLGSLVYFVAIYLPNSRLEHGARKVVAVAAKALDPTRELREAHAAFDYTPTAQNQMRLARAQLEAGQPAEAAQTYEACLKGPFASDLEIRLGAARACFDSANAAATLGHVDLIRQADANFRVEELALLRGRTLAALGRADEARAEFESAAQRFGSFESQAEYAIWAVEAGDSALAERLQAELQRAMARWNRHTRELNRPTLKRLEAALAKVAPQR